MNFAPFNLPSCLVPPLASPLFPFVFWRAVYNADLGWILAKQNKRKPIVREVCQPGWLDGSKRPEVRAWIRKQLSVEMGRDYGTFRPRHPKKTYDTMPDTVPFPVSACGDPKG